MKKKVPTEKEIAKKHGVSIDYVIRQAEIGSTVEREHVTTHPEAYAIALQHIAEFPDYYKHLLSMEKQLKKKWKEKKPMKENVEEIRYCYLCNKPESKHECRYGADAWEMATRTLVKTENYSPKSYTQFMKESAAWTRKEGKNKNGGLNEKGRKSYEAENPGSDLKPPQPEGGPRKDSFCARMKGMKNRLTSKKTANDPDSRINKSLRAWKC